MPRGSEARKHAAMAADRVRAIQDVIPGLHAARAMSERELQSCVIELAHVLGWRVAHFRNVQVIQGRRRVWQVPVQADGKGFPDLILVHPKHGVLWRELKAHRGRLSEDQHAWASDLDHAGADYRVWTPADWPGQIHAELKGDS